MDELLKDGVVSWNTRQLERDSLKDHLIWAKNKNDSDLDMEPGKLSGRSNIPCIEFRSLAYGLLSIKDLEESGIIYETSSSCSPCWPVLKINGTW